MLISINNISKSFGDNEILKDINLTIEDDDRIGLIGANGIGKSTFLNIINKHLDFENGNINYKNNIKIGYLKQDSGLIKNNTIMDEMKSVFSELIKLENEIRSIEKTLSTLDINSNEFLTVTAEYDKKVHFFEHMGGYEIDYKIKRVLNGLGFNDKEKDFNITNLSGGEKTRLALAKLLLEQPDLLILDEPTNHLDFKTLGWLEEYLNEYKGAILIVSHDRYFLDKMVIKIWELENKKIDIYKGNYSKYKILKQEKFTRALKEYEMQQLKINSMLEYAQKNIARASTANSAKSRLHQIDNMEILEKPIDYSKEPKFYFNYTKRPVKDVLTTHDLNLSVGGGNEKITLFNDLNLHILRGEKVAIIGENGVGKSTLLKSLVGLKKQAGEILWGDNVEIGYYDQENTNLNPEKKVIDELWDRFLQYNETEIRKILGSVLFTNDDVYKYVKVLSGGEKAKLGLAILMNQNCNTLVLDEPTNHLDLLSREDLERALKKFDGTLIFVSHDRYFLNQIPTRIIEMTKNGVNIYKGNFDYYIEQSKNQNFKEDVIDDINTNSIEKTNYKSKQQRSHEAKIRNLIKDLEKNIEETENRIIELEEIISNPNNSSDYLLLSESCEELDEQKERLENLLIQWEDYL